MSFEDIHARFGPTPATLENWAQKKVDMPRMGKMRAALKAVGGDILALSASELNHLSAVRTGLKR